MQRLMGDVLATAYSSRVKEKPQLDAQREDVVRVAAIAFALIKHDA